MRVNRKISTRKCGTQHDPDCPVFWKQLKNKKETG